MAGVWLDQSATGVRMESVEKLTWQQGERTAKASYSIPYIGELKVEVHAELPGTGTPELADDQRELALRHVKLLVRNFVSALDRESV
jgi:hypothetical protein